jgi:hypothetical protein
VSQRSEANAETIRRYVERFPPPVEGVDDWAAAFWDHDGDYYPVRKFPEARPCHGLDELARFITEYAEAWGDYSYELKEIRGLDDVRVLVHGRIRAVGRGSGMQLEGDIYQCFWLRNLRVIRQEDHLTPAGAARALGVSEQALSSGPGAAG